MVNPAARSVDSRLAAYLDAENAGVLLKANAGYEELRAFSSDTSGPAVTRATQTLWSGAAGPDSIRIGGTSTGGSVRLAIDTTPRFSGPTHSGVASPDGDGAVMLSKSGLEPSTQYYYALETDGAIDGGKVGKFKTAPPAGRPASFRFTAAACSGSAGCNYPYPEAGHMGPNTWKTSNTPTWLSMKAQNPDFHLHTGDLHYRNHHTEDPDLWRQAYTYVLSTPRQAAFYLAQPVAYIYDDHDGCGDNCNRTTPGWDAVGTVYRERVPSYDLSHARSAYHSFTYGRGLFVLCDCRSFRDPDSDPDSPTHTMLGTEQKTWLENTLSGSDAEFLVFVSTVEWMSGNRDTWAGFTYERDELTQMLGDTGWLGRMIGIQGNYHGIAMDSGAGNTWGGFPCYVLASVDSNTSGGPGHSGVYDLGTTSPGQDRYGVTDVTDTGGEISLRTTAWIGSGAFRTHTYTIEVD